MLDLVPLAGARREVVDGDLDAEFVGQGLKLTLPEPHARAVAPAPVGGDGQATDIAIAAVANVMPPGTDRLHGKCRRVVVDADADPTGIGGEIVDAIGHRPTEFLDQEVMHADLLGIATRPPLPAGVLEVSDQFLLLGVHRDHRLPLANAWLTLASMCANCASRSGWLPPSRILRLACRLNPSRLSSSPTTVWLI